MTFKAVRPVPPESNSSPKSQLKIPGGDFRINPQLLNNVNTPRRRTWKKAQVRELLTCSSRNCKIIRFDPEAPRNIYEWMYTFLQSNPVRSKISIGILRKAAINLIPDGEVNEKKRHSINDNKCILEDLESYRLCVLRLYCFDSTHFLSSCNAFNVFA